MTPALRIQALRRDAGMSVSDLAEAVNVSRNAIYGIESGATPRPRVATMKGIADALGVRVTEIWPVVPEEEPTNV